MTPYDRVLKIAHFDTNFMVLAYSVPKLWSSVISFIFFSRKFSDFWTILTFVNLILFFTENHWWECFLQNKTKRICILYEFDSKMSKLMSWFFTNWSKLTFLMKKQKQTELKLFTSKLMPFSILFQFYILCRVKLIKKILIASYFLSWGKNKNVTLGMRKIKIGIPEIGTFSAITSEV